jgi:succinyl-CoA synthetase beta subunit
VDCVLVEERVDIVRESYAGITIDGGDICLLFAREGGVDIEELAAADPSSFQAIRVDPLKGPDAGQLQDCFERLDYASAYWVAYEDVARRLFAMFGACDATMIEINPLAELGECRLLALDARVVIDDCALARQPLIGAMQPMLIPAGHAPGNLPTLRIKENPEGGSIGLIGLGGGLNVTLMDWIAASGAGVAALVDIDEAIGSSHAEDGFAAALDACERNPAIKSILVNVITCGYRLDDIVADLVRALDGGRTARTKPVILHLRGNSMARTPAILAATRWENCPSLAAAVAATIAAAKA